MALMMMVGLCGASCTGIESDADDASDVATGAAFEADVGPDGDGFDGDGPNGDGDESGGDSVDGCDPETVGEESGEVVTIYRVTDGQLDGVCMGAPEPILEESWEALAAVSPPEQLDAIELFSGFEGEGETLAFAGPVDDDDNDMFLVAVDLDSAADDFDELRLTVTHELAHVFTQTPDQLDIDIDPDSCDTFFNGLGCFEPDSYIWLWVESFWPSEAMDSLPDGGVSIDEPGGEDRCTLDRSFLGSYAASHPEEDFAESFSAFVFAVDVPAGVDPKMEWFEQWPELVAFRDRAVAADLDGQPSKFDRCG